MRPTSKVGGKWRYLFRTIDSQGRLIDFKLMEKRSSSAAYRFLKHAVDISGTLQPDKIVTDKSGAYPEAIARLKREKRLREETRHRTTKHLNNHIEADHGALKQRIKPTGSFKTMSTARATLKGFEVMRMIRRGDCSVAEPGIRGEVRFINTLFDLAA